MTAGLFVRTGTHFRLVIQYAEDFERVKGGWVADHVHGRGWHEAPVPGKLPSHTRP